MGVGEGQTYNYDDHQVRVTPHKHVFFVSCWIGFVVPFRLASLRKHEFLPLLLQFDWLQYLQKIFKPVDIEIKEDEQIVVYAPEYLKNMVTIYHETDKRSVFAWSPFTTRLTKGQSPLVQRSPQSSSITWSPLHLPPDR